MLLKTGCETAPADELELNVADHRGVKRYRFVYIGAEQVQTPAGTFDALRLDRVDSPKRVMRAWFAPSRGCTVVKLEQFKDGKVELRLSLRP